MVPLGGGAEVEGWNLLSMPLITTLVVDGFFGAGCEGGWFVSGCEIVCVSLSFSVGVDDPVSVVPEPEPACGTTLASAAAA